MTNLEGRMLLRQRAFAPPRGVWSDTQIIAALAERLGYGQRFPAEPRTIFEELRRASTGGIAEYPGITYERIAAENGYSGPAPTSSIPVRRGYFSIGSPPTTAGRALLQHHPAAEEPDKDYAFYLITGRVMAPTNRARRRAGSKSCAMRFHRCS